jgi:hypothetical protein
MECHGSEYEESVFDIVLSAETPEECVFSPVGNFQYMHKNLWLFALYARKLFHFMSE